MAGEKHNNKEMTGGKVGIGIRQGRNIGIRQKVNGILQLINMILEI